MSRLVIDTGILLGAADASDRLHAASVDVLERTRPADRVLPALIAGEAAWLIGDRLGAAAEAGFVASIAGGEFALVDLDADDWTRCAALCAQYESLRLGLQDAAVVAVAERLGIRELATHNRRDFAVVRPTHCDAFVLVP